MRRHPNHFVSRIAGAWFLVAAPLGLFGGGERTWTSQAGTEFVGAMEEIRGREVVLAGADGREITVALDDLSARDREFIRNQQDREREQQRQFYRHREFPGEGLPENAEVVGVEHVAQDSMNCVPASAEMVLRFYGFSYDQDYLAAISSRQADTGGGTQFRHLARALENLGVESVGFSREGRERGDETFENVMNGIRHAIADGRPVMIAHDTGAGGHMVVAIGYDDRRESLTVHDPAAQSGPTRLGYKDLEEVLKRAVVVFPDNSVAELIEEDRTEVLREISEIIRNAGASNAAHLARAFDEAGLSARVRDVNRGDLADSQGQTRSYAREYGVDFVRQAVERGLVVVAPQDLDEGVGMALIYGVSGGDFQAVEYFPDGSFSRGELRPLDFSLRWIWRNGREYKLPIVEVRP